MPETPPQTDTYNTALDIFDRTHPLRVDADENLKVTIAGSGGVTIGTVNQGTSPWIVSGSIITTPVNVSPLVVGAVTGVTDGTLTTIVTYTAPATMRVSRISVSGTLYAKYQLFFNTVLIETQRSGPERSLNFDFNLPLAMVASDILDVKVTHYQIANLGDFESTIYGG